MDWRRGLSCGLAVLLFCGLAPRTATAQQSSNAGPILEELGKQVTNQSLPTTERVQVIKTLGQWATADVRPPLVAALKDPHPEIREAAARALGWAGNVEAVPVLRERVEAEGEPMAVKAAAVRSLGVIGDRSVRPLVVSLSNDPDPKVREAAVWGLALGALAEPADRTGYLIQFAEDRAFDPTVRSQAVRALTAVNEERVVASLSRILQTEPPLTVTPPTGQPSEQEVMALRLMQIRDVAAFAVGALGRLDARSALPLVLKSAEDPNDFFLRLVSVETLVAWNVPEALPVFVRSLADPLTDVRIWALVGLERLGDQRAVGPVFASLSDQSVPVRARAVTTLAALGGSKVRPQLEALEQRELEPEVRAALETALSKLAR